MVASDSEYSSDDLTSESDYESLDSSLNSPLRSAIKTALNMEADKPNSDPIRDRINKLMNAPSTSGNGSSGKHTRLKAAKNSVDPIKDCITQMKDELLMHNDRMDKLFQILIMILDRVGDLEKRLFSLENRQSTPSQSYSSAVTHIDTPSINRIERLEYLSSEDERKKRLLQVSIKHPLIDINSTDLCKHMKEFMAQTLRMNPREIDANLTANKASKSNSVILNMSHRRFKLFLYKARKTLRDNENDPTTGLYMNDNLTSHNFNLFMMLKNEKKRRSENNLKNFDTLYTIDGKIFVKISRQMANNETVHIKNRSDYESFLSKLVVSE